MYFGCTRKSLSGNAPTSVQYALCFMGCAGPGGLLGGTAAGSVDGGLIPYAGGDPANAAEATSTVVAAIPATRLA
jgi:hypothetical protein